MRRFWVRLVGFGIVAFAGTATAADLGVPRPVPAGGVVRAIPDPAALPASVRFASATTPADPDPLWLPSKAKSGTPAAVSAPPAVFPESARPPAASVPVARPLQAVSAPPAAGPRIGAVPAEPVAVLPVAPPLPEPTPPPALPADVLPGTALDRTQVAPSDGPAPVPRKTMADPTPPPGFLPAPRSATPAAPGVHRAPSVYGAPVAELPTAPPDVMAAACAPVPGKHGTFGSMPISLSRDYPTCHELCGTPIRDRLGFGLARTGAPGERGFVQAEYLMWWANGFNIPVLATTNPDPNRFGFLGEPGTVPIFGPGEILGSTRHGVRVRGGLWLDECGTCGIDASAFVLGRKSADFAFTSEQFGIITRPIFSPNVRPGLGSVIGETGEAVTVPGVLRGSLTAHAESFLWGADANVRHCLFTRCDARSTWFAGYRYLNLQESIDVTENIFVIGDGGGRVIITDPVGSVVVVKDRFATENQFHGGQVGATYERRRGRVTLDGRGSIGIGATHQELSIFGSQTRVRPGQPPATFRGGLLAAGPNLGTFTRERFSVVPEFTLNLGYQVTPNLKAYVGYNFLYWSNVIRPGDQIDRVVDLTFVPNAPSVPPSGQNRPAPLFKQSDLIVHGVQFGAEWRW